MALSCAEETAPRAGIAGPFSSSCMASLAKECLREAETVPEGMRLSHIMIAQLWLDLADKVTQLRREIAGDAALSGESTLSD